tara:strand:- start:48 stop:320 length:273 start_codon:yes stop_codon:yes gene_type:complete
VKNIKLNPFIRDFDAIRDEKLDVIIGKQWVEVKESDWKRLAEAQTKQGDSLIPTFIAEGDGMGEVKSIVSEETINNDDEWFGTDEVVEEE